MTPLESPYETLLMTQLHWAGIETPTRELKFAADIGRRWRFDFAWPDQKIAVECEGGGWNQGRHVRGAGFLKDLEKYAEASLRGWTVIRVAPSHIEDGTALDWIRRALEMRKELAA